MLGLQQWSLPYSLTINTCIRCILWKEPGHVMREEQENKGSDRKGWLRAHPRPRVWANFSKYRSLIVKMAFSQCAWRAPSRKHKSRHLRRKLLEIAVLSDWHSHQISFLRPSTQVIRETQRGSAGGGRTPEGPPQGS